MTNPIKFPSNFSARGNQRSGGTAQKLKHSKWKQDQKNDLDSNARIKKLESKTDFSLDVSS
jgi:hypothetical protein